jgi:putative DNA primase/helicase
MNHSKRIVARYDYVDEHEQLAFQVVRYEPKDFRQRRPDGNGGWEWSMEGVCRVPYRLPEVLEAVSMERTIFIAEGEKAVDALVKLEVPVTCSPGGAKKWHDEYSQYLADANVVILPDNDEPGKRHCDAVARSLVGVNAKVSVLRLPDLPAKGDVYDWLQAGGTAEQLWQLVEKNAVSWRPEDYARPHGASLISRCAADIEPERVEWLWGGRLARGKHTCIAGEPGTGKSQVSVALAATITTGGQWPCDEGCAPLGSVIILSAEDGAADTIVPRLHAAGADVSRVHIVSAVCDEKHEGHRSFDLKADLHLLEEKTAQIGDAALIVIDPISSYMGKADSHKNADVRGILEPIAEMADRTGIAVLTVTHFKKPNGGAATKALHKFIGSVAFVAAARAAFVVIEDPDDRNRRLFLPAKNNLALPPQGLAFRLKERIIGEGVFTSCVDWEPEPVAMTADEVLAAGGKSSLALDEAEDFLQALLADGPVTSKQVEEEAQEVGITKATLRRAKKELGIKPRKNSMKGGWLWALPEMPAPTEDAHSKNMSTFEMDEHLRTQTARTAVRSNGQIPEDRD